MKTNSSIDQFTENVLAAYATIDNPRLNKLIQSLIIHFHSYVKETNLSESEWEFDLADGKPIQNATLDIWQAATNGFYETQDPNQLDMNLRGKFKTDNEGTYELVALMPTPYPVPTDGPVGELLKIAKRHPNRPAHIHFIVSAPGYETLITQIFVAGDEIIKTDAVFTTNENMIGNFIKKNDHYSLIYNFQLTKGKSIHLKLPFNKRIYHA